MSASGLFSTRSGLIAAAALVSICCGWTPAAVAADFTQACEANSALDTGKLSDADKKSCACIKAKLDEKAQGGTASVLEKVLANRKAGKGSDKPDMTPDEEKAMGAFVQGMQGCVSDKQ